VRRTAGAVVLGTCLAAGLVSGCGSDARSAADQVPGLSARLTSIDGAIAAHKYVAARGRIAALVHQTISARDAGTLQRDQAETVLAAAAQLLASLPTATPTPKPVSTPTAEATAARTAVRTPVHRAPARHPAPHHAAPKPPKKHGHGKKH
jgi:hypothetical protein